MKEMTTMTSAAGDDAPPHAEASAGGGWRQGGTALVMVASVIAYGVMTSGCAGV